jgi:hypothetical protein
MDDKLIGNIKIIVSLTLEFLYKRHLHLVVLSGKIKRCSLQSAININQTL